MTHHINGFIGPVDELQRLTTGRKSAIIAVLEVNGLGFLPYTTELSAEIGKDWYELGRQAKEPLVHVETDYFGGAGDQSAAFWKGGQKHFKAKKTGAINQALKMLGVKAANGKDEFDTIGLGKFRTNESWAIYGEAQAGDEEEKERQEALRVLDELRKTDAVFKQCEYHDGTRTHVHIR